MLYSRSIANLRKQTIVSLDETRKRLAFKASSQKPKDASPLPKRKTVFMMIARFFKRIWRWLGLDKLQKTYTMQPYNPPRSVAVSKGKRGRTHNARHVTPPKAFGSSRSGHKLPKGIKEVSHA